MSEKNPHLFCFGLGFSALALAEICQKNGWRVSGTVRSAHKQEQLQMRGITAHIYDENLPLLYPDAAFSGVTHILISIPPNDSGDIVFQDYAEIINNLPHLEWLGYCSTTGVYGDHNGAWVDENSPTNPKHLRAKRRLMAEEQWLQNNKTTHIFRISGIYGPKRSALDSLKNGSAKRIDKPGHVFCRIHVDDIAQALFASTQNKTAGEIFNLADDNPAEQSEVIAYAAEILHITPPALIKFENADLSEMARDFYSANRRVSSKKIKEKLGIKWLYPSYKEGLLHCLLRNAGNF
jgi:nucleoside-diphosphate-sugar epimerase